MPISCVRWNQTASSEGTDTCHVVNWRNRHPAVGAHIVDRPIFIKWQLTASPRVTTHLSPLMAHPVALKTGAVAIWITFCRLLVDLPYFSSVKVTLSSGCNGYKAPDLSESTGAHLPELGVNPTLAHVLCSLYFSHGVILWIHLLGSFMWSASDLVLWTSCSALLLTGAHGVDHHQVKAVKSPRFYWHQIFLHSS